jgi:hypothetical protein
VGALFSGFHGEYGDFKYEPTGAISAAIVLGLVWFFHWREFQARVKAGGSDRDLVSFHLMMATFLLIFGVSAYAIAAGNQLIALTGIRYEHFDWNFGRAVVNLAISTLLWVYHLRLFRQLASAKTKARKA